MRGARPPVVQRDLRPSEEDAGLRVERLFDLDAGSLQEVFTSSGIVVARLGPPSALGGLVTPHHLPADRRVEDRAADLAVVGGWIEPHPHLADAPEHLVHVAVLPGGRDRIAAALELVRVVHGDHDGCVTRREQALPGFHELTVALDRLGVAEGGLHVAALRLQLDALVQTVSRGRAAGDEQERKEEGRSGSAGGHGSSPEDGASLT